MSNFFDVMDSYNFMWTPSFNSRRIFVLYSRYLYKCQIILVLCYGVRRGGLRLSWAPRSAAHLCFVYYTIRKMSYYTIIIIAVVIIPLLGGQYKGYRFINRETPYSSWQRSRAGIRSFPTRTRWPQTFRTTSITTRVTTIL